MTRGGSRVVKHIQCLAAKGSSDGHGWFGPAGLKASLEMQLPARRFFTNFQAFGLWDYGLRWKCSSALDADATGKGAARGVPSGVVKISHPSKAGSSRATSGGQVAHQESFGKIWKVLSKADIWKPELEEELRRLQLELDPRLVNRVIARVRHKTNVAHEFLQWAKTKGYKANLNDYGPLIKGLMRAGLFDKAQTVLEQMVEEGYFVHTNVFRSLIHAFSSAGRPDDALEVLDQMKFFDCEPNREVYSAVFRAIRRTDIDLLALIQRELGRWGHSPLKLTMFMSVLFHRNGGQVDQAWSLYQQARQNGWALEAKSYAELIVLLGRAGRREEARDLYKEMAGKGLALDASEVELHLQYFDALGLTEERCKYLQDCRVSRLEKPSSVASVIWDLLSCGKVEEAIDFYSEKRSQGFRFKYQHSFSRMLEAVSGALMSGKCNVSVLEALWQDMTERTVPTTRTLSMVISILGQGPQGDEMIWKVFQEMRSRGWPVGDSQTYSTLIHRFSESGKTDVATELWRQMHKKTLECRSTSLTSLVRSLVQEGKTSEARAVADKAKCTEMYDAIVREVKAAGNQEAAVQFFQKVQEEEGFQDAVVYNEATL